MKKIIKLGIIFLSAAITHCAYSQSFQEGMHFTRMALNVKTQKTEVVEYFSFSCPGCYALEPSLKGLVDNKGVFNFRRVHMPFGGRKARLSQKAFVLMELLNARQHKDKIFSQIHVQRDLFDNDDEIVTFFEKLGYERTFVQQTLDSFSADSLIRKMNQEAFKMKIKSVPTIIVNGKYMINLRSLNSTLDIVPLIKHLNTLEK